MPSFAANLVPGFIDGESLLNALPHAILVIGSDRGIVFANQAAEQFFSMSAPTLGRSRIADIVAFGSPLLPLIEQVETTGATVSEYAIEVASPRIGTPKLVDIFAGPLPEDPSFVFLMLQHRSVAQMIERQLTHRAAARSVSGMADMLAHEIKNPLSGIRGAAQLLEPGLSDEDRSLTQLICAETDRIRDLVDRMEVFGDERPLTKDAVNIHDVLSHVRKIAQHGFGSRIEFIENYDPSLPHVLGNRDKLVQLFLNLLKNAAESIGARSGNGRIVLQTAFRPGVRLSLPGTGTRVSLPLMIQIEDNGAGIPDHLKQHLFDPFVTTKPSGNGLGLALVAKIVADHGGIIECESEDKRTAFRVLLPMQQTRGEPSTSE
ncbi:two-component system sensor histidine kinase NtrB [Hyphomicrobium methylovorum]|uniref:two-component system sensor histidine kinase NtrB n=1 Tax=Hyphomicrobium methylovorum TaxID=84 RepID=UPI001FE34F7B|nr:ATP-binding protein [Hyphomicrobium methylovorum]